ncbi:hypothetical protein D9M68_756120 [compost metagenome]
MRAATHDAVIEVEVVAAFFEHEAARIALVTTPVAHEERAMVRRNVLGRLDGGDVAQQPIGLRLAQIDIERRIAQHETNHQIV